MNGIVSLARKVRSDLGVGIMLEPRHLALRQTRSFLGVRQEVKSRLSIVKGKERFAKT
jgi:hypothetical protein